MNLPVPLRRAAACSIFLLAAYTSHAATYTFTVASGTTGNWNSTSSWTPASIPNAIGDNIVKTVSTTLTVFQDISAGVTVGGISTTNGSFIIQTDNQLTLNNGGSGVTVSNLVSTGSTALLTIGTASGTPTAGITLADNVSFVNSFAGNTNPSGAIKLNAIIGGTGNVTYSNVLNNAVGGQIRVEGTNTYTGTTTVAKGAVTFTKNTAFGDASNTLVLGSVGQGSVLVVSSTALGGSFAGSGNMANNITVTAGTGGTTTLGTVNSGSTNYTNFSGRVTLNGDLTTTSTQTVLGQGLFFTNTISGSGKLTVSGVGITHLTGTNTYTGDTRIASGTLAIGNSTPTSGASTSLALQSTTVDLNASDTGGLVFGTGTGSGIVNVTLGGLKGSRNLALVNTNASPAGVTLSVGNNNADTSYSGTLSGAGGLTKIGTGKLTLSAAHTYTGNTTVSAGTLLVNGSIGNGAVSVSGTLGGTGQINPGGSNGLTVNASGVVAPGDGGIESLGISLASTTGVANFATNATFSFDLAAPGSSDSIDFTGLTAASDVVFHSNVINFNNLGGLAVGTYTLFTFNGSNLYTGTLVVGTGLGAYTGNLNYNADSITLDIVPEPSTIALATAGGMFALFGWVRRKRVS